MGNKLNKENLEFEGSQDNYDGIIVDSSKEPCDLKEFPGKLTASMEQWKNEKKRGIWFKIHLESADWIPVLIKNGFRFHHAQESYVMMIHWLPEHEPCNIPKYPHHYIGIGAFVVNESSQEVLVVKERYGLIGPNWKLPGGYVERKENLDVASQREVYEETGISTEFVSMVGFRQKHNVQFQCSDIYFVCHLRPIDTHIKRCDKELIDCRWMPLREYSESAEVNDVNRKFARAYLDHTETGIAMTPHTITLNDYEHVIYAMNLIK